MGAKVIYIYRLLSGCVEYALNITNNIKDCISLFTDVLFTRSVSIFDTSGLPTVLYLPTTVQYFPYNTLRSSSMENTVQFFFDLAHAKDNI